MQVSRERGEEVVLEFGLEGVQGSDDAQMVRKGIPATGSIVREGACANRGGRMKRPHLQLHVDRAYKAKFVSKRGRSTTGQAAKDEDKELEMDTLLNGKPVQFVVQCSGVTPGGTTLSSARQGNGSASGS